MSGSTTELSASQMPPSADAGHGSKTSFWALTLGSVGIVYGDIGTSPLYALKESLHAATGGGHAPTRDMVCSLGRASSADCAGLGHLD